MFGKNRAIVLLNQASCFLQKQRYDAAKRGADDAPFYHHFLQRESSKDHTTPSK